MSNARSLVPGTHENECLVRLVAAFNAHDERDLRSLFADSYEGFDVSRESMHRGPRQVGRGFELLLSAFPDLSLDAVQIIEPATDTVGLFWIVSGTHVGQFLRVPPTSRTVSVCGFSLLRHRNGKFLHGLHMWDQAGLLRRLRLLPDLPDASADSQEALFVRALSTFTEPFCADTGASRHNHENAA